MGVVLADFKMKNLIKNSKRILVTSHTNCDQDGVCSALATKLILEKNFSGKKVVVNIESELQKNVSFLKGLSEIETKNLFKYIENFKPDLIIFTDSSSLKRFSDDFEKIQEIIKQENIKTILIDHHKTKLDFSVDFLFNNHRSSCAEEIYHLFVKELRLKIDSSIAEVILTGMIFDTGVFVYNNEFFRQTANVVADLVEMGANIEKILSYKNVYSKKDMEVVAELSKNVVLKKDFSYSYIGDDFLKKNLFTADQYKHAYHAWVDIFLKNIEGRKWGFVVRPEIVGHGYGVTLRSQK